MIVWHNPLQLVSIFWIKVVHKRLRKFFYWAMGGNFFALLDQKVNHLQFNEYPFWLSASDSLLW